MMSKEALLNAPPRISDLRGDDLRQALFDRKKQHDANWLRDRQQQGFLARLFARAA
jgi:hypothetical protein